MVFCNEKVGHMVVRIDQGLMYNYPISSKRLDALNKVHQRGEYDRSGL